MRGPLRDEGVCFGQQNLLLFQRQPAGSRKDPESRIWRQLVERHSWHDGDILILAATIATADKKASIQVRLIDAR
jgi:hypothetical protein